jgi:hypothetical protein
MEIVEAVKVGNEMLINSVNLDEVAVEVLCGGMSNA